MAKSRDSGRILVVDDEAGIRAFMADALQMDGHEVVQAADGAEARRLLDQQAFDVVLTDLRMPGVDGMQLLEAVRRGQPETQVVVLTAHGSVEGAVQAMKLGAFDFLQKPIDGPDALSLLVARALERRRLLDVRDRAARTTPGEPPLSHGDPVMKPIVEAIEKVAPTNATVLLLGESGTGKEVAARTIHALSTRRGGPFMAVNCAALSETLLESELFGHEKGAFTGASERRRGRIELADGGSFFLDEIGEMKLELQAKLLRVIQERRFERVGGTRTLQSDVRWVAATNRDLRALIQEGRFREDLYHRLAVFPIRLPPLRERKRDLIPIAEALLARIGGEMGRPGLILSGEAAARLRAWPWPGNVRELGNALERAVILAEGTRIEAGHIWLEDGGAAAQLGGAPSRPPEAAASTPEPPGPAATLADVEREAIARALEACGGNRKRAAAQLGIGERTLYDKIKRYGLG